MKVFKLFCVMLFGAAMLHAESSQWRQEAAVSARSNGEARTIYAQIQKRKTENRLSLAYTKLPTGEILLESGAFKLGKMPFAARFKFTIPKENCIKNEAGVYTVENIEGAYTVLSSAHKTMLSGTFNESHCALTVTVEGMRKAVELSLSADAQ